jgi:hypothetical protein
MKEKNENVKLRKGIRKALLKVLSKESKKTGSAMREYVDGVSMNIADKFNKVHLERKSLKKAAGDSFGNDFKARREVRSLPKDASADSGGHNVVENQD